jgi:hypothetical protein
MKKTIEKMINFLKEAEKILDGEEFEDLGKRKKQAIFDALIDTGIPYSCGGDSDYTFLEVVIEHFSLVFYSHSEYSYVSEIRKMLDEMTLEIGDDDAKIQEAIEYLRNIKPVPLGILNTSILTSAGKYTLTDISLKKARELVSDNVLDSAVGHASTAEVMTTLLGVEIPVNRQQFSQRVGQQALVFKLNGRLEEGKILTVEDIEKIGFKFQLLTREA